MMGMMKRQPSARWWWFERHQTPGRSQWLQSTLAELDQKTEAMLQLIEEDADSFAMRAEMYYKKRPQLISMVEDFYRAHRSLAEKYDQVKSDSGTRLVTMLGTPFSSMAKSRLEKSTSGKTYDSFSEICDHEECAESEVDDPEQEYDHLLVDGEAKDEEVLSEVIDEVTKDDEVLSMVSSYEVIKLKEELWRLEEENRIQKDQLQQKDEEVLSKVNLDEVTKLKEELRRLEEENRVQKDQLNEKQEAISEASLYELTKLKEELLRLAEENRIQKDELEQKDEEKREAIRQLSLAVDMLKEENAKLKMCIARDSPKKSSSSALKTESKETFLRKLFKRPQRSYGIAGYYALRS